MMNLIFIAALVTLATSQDVPPPPPPGFPEFPGLPGTADTECQSPDICKDLAKSCSKLRGLCQFVPNSEMYCPVTCKACKPCQPDGEELRICEKDEIKKCEDSSKYCSLFSSHCNAQSALGIIASKRCEKTCGNCEEQPTDCINIFDG